MEKLARNSDFCPNAGCPDYGKLQSDQAQTNLKKIGKTPRFEPFVEQALV
jgi:hypothetical protein